MKALVVPGVGAILEDGRLIPARESTETEGLDFAAQVQAAVASARPLVGVFDHAYVVEIARLTDPRTLVDEIRRPRTCRGCGKSFEARNATLDYCSVICRPHPGYRKPEAPEKRARRKAAQDAEHRSGTQGDRRRQIGPGRRLLARQGALGAEDGRPASLEGDWHIAPVRTQRPSLCICRVRSRRSWASATGPSEQSGLKREISFQNRRPSRTLVVRSARRRSERSPADRDPARRSSAGTSGACDRERLIRAACRRCRVDLGTGIRARARLSSPGGCRHHQRDRFRGDRAPAPRGTRPRHRRPVRCDRRDPGTGLPEQPRVRRRRPELEPRPKARRRPRVAGRPHAQRRGLRDPDPAGARASRATRGRGRTALGRLIEAGTVRTTDRVRWSRSVSRNIPSRRDRPTRANGSTAAARTTRSLLSSRVHDRR